MPRLNSKDQMDIETEEFKLKNDEINFKDEALTLEY
jgi:hypothetical protein